MFLLKALPTRQMVDRYLSPANNEKDDAAETVLNALSMMRSASLLIRDIERHFASHDMSQLKFLIMVVIDREAHTDSLSHSDVQDRIDVSKPVLSRSIRALVAGGFISEIKDKADARSLRLQVTDAGRAKLSQVLPGYFDIIQSRTTGAVVLRDPSEVSKFAAADSS